MRVITGSARGRKLKPIPGMETRPTTDRLKETMFNIVQFDIEGRRVLDLFAGTGQLGIEALSRGARECVFIDSAQDAVKIIKENVKSSGFTAPVYASDAIRFLSTEKGKYGLVFLDPPYSSGLLEKSLRAIVNYDILIDGGLIMAECGETAPELQAPYKLEKLYSYGSKHLALYKRSEGED